MSDPRDIPEPPGDGHVYGRRPSTWEAVLSLLGGTMIGPLHLWNTTPRFPEEAASKDYVDNRTGGSDKQVHLLHHEILLADIPLPPQLPDVNNTVEIFRTTVTYPPGRHLIRITVQGLLRHPYANPDAYLYCEINGRPSPVVATYTTYRPTFCAITPNRPGGIYWVAPVVLYAESSNEETRLVGVRIGIGSHPPGGDVSGFVAIGGVVGANNNFGGNSWRLVIENLGTYSGVELFQV